MYGWISDTNFNFNWSENYLRDLIFREQNYFENDISVIYHSEETSKNSDICYFSKVSDIGKVLYSMEN